ncbi:bile acid:sodium symporter family protein [Microbulbifer agarilyticus]|uniref:bile acid:sodium symporter family protein n=1 Tax=Microbulbifer agarilyticus TaxID=260552 RepID=UPI001CD21489|nr:bile acid:sodium symporter family protein [Microbulbifer agarilyticus]MCA0892218.1 bile acid:sodium symporter family protein [Microbulbifer agarilyticus]
MDPVSLDFNPETLVALNIMIAIMMFGVSLELKPDDFKRIARNPKAPIIGLVLQFLILPAATCAATWLLKIDPMLAMGMMLVASCPGGTFSNIMTWVARGNVAVSVSMTAVSSVAASVLTPLNFALYSWLNPHTRPLLTEIAMDPISLLLVVIMVLGVPLVLGMLVGGRFPGLSRKVEKPLRLFAMGLMLLLAAIAFFKNTDQFLQHFNLFFFLVVAHNALALFLGYWGAKLSGLPPADCRAISLEVGIQNGALALVIIFTFFPNASGMLLIAGFWGVWHLVSGITLSTYWSRRPLEASVQTHQIQNKA